MAADDVVPHGVDRNEHRRARAPSTNTNHVEMMPPSQSCSKYRSNCSNLLQSGRTARTMATPTCRLVRRTGQGPLQLSRHLKLLRATTNAALAHPKLPTRKAEAVVPGLEVVWSR